MPVEVIVGLDWWRTSACRCLPSGCAIIHQNVYQINGCTHRKKWSQIGKHMLSLTKLRAYLLCRSRALRAPCPQPVCWWEASLSVLWRSRAHAQQQQLHQGPLNTTQLWGKDRPTDGWMDGRTAALPAARAPQAPAGWLQGTDWRRRREVPGLLSRSLTSKVFRLQTACNAGLCLWGSILKLLSICLYGMH